MIANLGLGTLVITFLVSLYGIGAALYGALGKKPKWVDSARNAMLLTFPLLTLVAGSIIYLLVADHFEMAYVSQVTSRSMEPYLRVTALWGGQAGSLIFWSWLMSAFASAATLRKWDRDREFLPWVVVVSLVTLSFFLLLNIFVENPFERLWALTNGSVVPALFQPIGARLYNPGDGNGLNPLLRHPGMIIHPPMLYLGFVAFTIPYAFAMAALITGRTDDRWIRITRRWTLVAWLFLSLGLVLGGRWAYDVLGWGGYWGWDPVEIAAFMPWLVGTPFLHSVMIQEKRGMFKHWNMFLIILTYDLVIFGTFLTRSGVISSVHAFAQSSIGPLFFTFIGLTFITSLGLLFYRWEGLQSEGELTSMFSREALFLLNNLLFILIMIVCFIGVVFPILSEALGFLGQTIPGLSTIFTGEKMNVGPEWYERITGPLFGGLLLLMGIAPLSAWRYSTYKTLGKAAFGPLVFSLLVVGAIFAIGVRSVWGLIGFWLVAFDSAIHLYEFWRASWARSQAHGENLVVALWNLAGRNRRRYGGYVIHIGVVLMAIGIIGLEMFQVQTQGSIPIGGKMSLGSYTLTYTDLKTWDTADGKNVTRAVLEVSKNGKSVGELYPRRDYYYESQQNMTIPGLRSTLIDDFYVILVDWQPISTQGATFKIYHNPLVNWLWIGSMIFIFGTMIATWPDKDPELVPSRQRAGRYVPARASGD